jgi:hypothetical protein
VFGKTFLFADQNCCASQETNWRIPSELSVSDLEERAQILAHALDGRLDSLLPPPADSPEPEASVAQRRNRQVLESDDDLEGGDGASSALDRQHSNKRKRGEDSSEDEDNEELLMDRLFRPSSTPQANKKKVQTGSDKENYFNSISMCHQTKNSNVSCFL